MKVITYHIELDEPVLATALAGDPNTGASFDYLPGSVLRGALITAYMRQKQVKALTDSDETAQRLFLNGQTQYLNGYLLDRERQRALPRPLSWRQEKEAQQRETEDAPAALFDFAYEEREDDPEKQWKAAKKPFFSFTKKGEVRWLWPDTVLAVHTQRDPVKGRSTTEQGAVYQYEALAAGQTFAAMIVCHHDADEPFLSGLLEGEHNVGGSRGAGYGRVRFTKIKTNGVREMSGKLESESNGRLLVTCLSDLLLQNEQGQFQADPRLVQSALEKQLKCELAWFGGNQLIAFMNGNHIGGFNRKWGLPLPQAKAISMGSVFVFEPPEEVTVAQLQAVEAQGLGLRRAEGFGRIAFNWQTEETWKVEEWVQPGRPSTITLSSESSEGQLAQTMVNRLFRQQLDAQLAAKVANWAANLPVQNSQISRLRQVVQDELYKRPSEEEKSAAKIMQDGRDRLRNYAQKLKERAATRQQFDRARMDGKPLLDWLEERLKDDASIEATLPVAAASAIGDTKGQWTAVMRYEYNLRLIDLTLAHCLKKGKEGN